MKGLTEEQIIEEMKTMLDDNLNLITSMSVEEYTLYRKWQEVTGLNWKDAKFQNRVQHVKNNIWIPEKPEDFENLNVKVIPATTPDDLLTWRILRIFTSTAHYNPNPGRSLRFYLVHSEDIIDPFFGQKQGERRKYLGVISLGSDFLTIGGRDSYVGWNDVNKLDHGMLKHTAMGSSIVPTQPLGYNFLGGKLISLMVLSDVVESTWNNQYDEDLVGVTTTSLYGGFSQYNNLKYWRKCTSSQGNAIIEPCEHVYQTIKTMFREHFPMDYKYSMEFEDGKKKSHPKTKLMNAIYKKLGVRQRKNDAPRGVYFARLYENTIPFLKEETTDLGKKLFKNDVATLTSLWKEKYASKRISKLIDTGSYNDDVLFYDGLKDLEWDEAKQLYLNNVGR